ncbi:hypothetical protein BES34_021520 [Leptospira inadai serovar Lyme]|uniref:Uncharacterized protein n=1 Tax=Leptospira inadai serovar Lyme TaxID=293084 RepID=A0ABX4YCI1_9LEPT|nr:hypothetical protein BES34_021520 [Leptospira inadai serovar Lyme]
MKKGFRSFIFAILKTKNDLDFIRFSLTGRLGSLHWFLRPFSYGKSSARLNRPIPTEILLWSE